MALEFNYQRAHREWAQPHYNQLSAAVLTVWGMVCNLTDKLHQLKDLSVGWPEEHPELREAFDEIPADELARAAFIIYRWGHWAHVEAIIVEYPGLPPRRFEADDFDSMSPSAEARAWIEQLDTYPPPRTEKVLQHRHLAGPAADTGGATWKFEKLAKQSLIARGYSWSEDVVACELGFDHGAFIDHKPGTDYSLDEKHVLFTGLFGEHVQPLKVIQCNYKPHPFTIGPKHIEAAQEYGGILNEAALRKAPCAHPDCLRGGVYRDYDEHTHDTVLVLKLTGNVKNSELTHYLKAAHPKFEEHGIDGVTFMRSEYTVIDDRPDRPEVSDAKNG